MKYSAMEKADILNEGVKAEHRMQKQTETSDIRIIIFLGSVVRHNRRIDNASKAYRHV